jgi:L-asparaginase II
VHLGRGLVQAAERSELVVRQPADATDQPDETFRPGPGAGHGEARQRRPFRVDDVQPPGSGRMLGRLRRDEQGDWCRVPGGSGIDESGQGWGKGGVDQKIQVVELARRRRPLRGRLLTLSHGLIVPSHAVRSSVVAAPEILVDVVRSGFVEGHHRGAVVALTADGAVDWSIGVVDAPIYPRSCNKPIQVAAMLRLGLDLDGGLLAVAAASHSGEPFHIEAVRRILTDAGLDESALRTPPDYPLDDEARIAFIRSDRPPSPIAMNCSGKHAAMLATCVANDWDLSTYLDQTHPLQEAIAATFAELTGEAVTSVGVDGCGAPLFASSLTGLASAFRALATADVGTPERRVADAIRAFPEYVSGSRRDEAALLRAIPGAIAKAGAESCYALALTDGRAVALKIDDGSARGRPVVMAAALRRLEVDRLAGVDAEAVSATGVALLLGGGIPVGELRSTF